MAKQDQLQYDRQQQILDELISSGASDSEIKQAKNKLDSIKYTMDNNKYSMYGLDSYTEDAEGYLIAKDNRLSVNGRSYTKNTFESAIESLNRDSNFIQDNLKLLDVDRPTISDVELLSNNLNKSVKETLEKVLEEGDNPPGYSRTGGMQRKLPESNWYKLFNQQTDLQKFPSSYQRFPDIMISEIDKTITNAIGNVELPEGWKVSDNSNSYNKIFVHESTGLEVSWNANERLHVDPDNVFKNVINRADVNKRTGSLYSDIGYEGPRTEIRYGDVDYNKPINELGTLLDKEKEKIVNPEVDGTGNIKNYSMKGLDFLGKAVAPIDEALELGIPKLFAGTALAPFAQNLIKTFRQLALVNLGLAVTKGLYESDVMGENYQNLLQDPDNPEYIAERERLNQEGLQAFSEHMSTYDPSIRFIDSFTEDKLGFNQSDAATKVFGGIRNLFGGK